MSDQNFRRDRRVLFSTTAPFATAPSGVTHNATTIDISESGVRLRFQGRIAPGQIVEVFFAKRPERCRVVWTSVEYPSQELIAGLEFLCPLPEPRVSPPPAPSGCEQLN
jgi:hypothetical protein